VADVKKLQRRMRERSDLAGMEKEAAELGKDYLAAQKLYRDYLKAHPEATTKEALQARITALEKGAQRQRGWRTVKRYAANPKNSLGRRVAKVRTYVDRNGKSPYIAEARDLLDQLSDQKAKSDARRRAEAVRRAAEARRAAEHRRQQAEAERIAGLENQYHRLVGRVAQRYHSNGNGTFLDMSTGKTWTLLDSTQMLGYCVDYAGANTYVHGLNTGGYHDWRLPTPGELAAIYKSEPFFPLSEAYWYWSSESFIRGYNRGAFVVTGTHEQVFNRESREASACGAVRAVRP
jgi:antitoxin component HigA of HigAB toxin-antitoxin module